MSKSYIISSFNPEFIKQQINELKLILKINDVTADFYEVTPQLKKQSIGIEATRKLKEWFKVKPYNSPNKLAVINNANLLTIEAQNSILKLLEEPNKNCYIVLSLDNNSMLLPTVLSRCELILDGSELIWENNSKFMELSKKEQFLLVENLLNIKDPITQNLEIKQFLLLLLKTLETKLQSDYMNIVLKQNIDLVEQTSIMISGNTSKKLALENMVINMK